MLATKVKGAIFLSLVIVIWVGSAVLIRAILTSSTTSFNKPLFLTYYNTAFFLIYLIPLIRAVYKARKAAEADGEELEDREHHGNGQRELDGEAGRLNSASATTRGSGEPTHPNNLHSEVKIVEQQQDNDESTKSPLLKKAHEPPIANDARDELSKLKAEVKHVARISLEFCILWVLSNYFYNSGLASTTVSSSTVLCNTSSIFVYVFGLCALPGVRFGFLKAGMVLLSFSGIVLITISDSSGSSSTDEQASSLKGNLLSLLSAVCYGLYAVVLKRRIPPEEEETFQFSYFLGFVGLFNVVLILPMFPLLHVTGVEVFQWPNRDALWELTLNAIIGTVISDFCWAKSVVLLGPLLTTLGIAMTIPISMVVDSFYDEKKFSWEYFLGSALILTSFLSISWLDYRAFKHEEQEKQKLDDPSDGQSTDN